VTHRPETRTKIRKEKAGARLENRTTGLRSLGGKEEGKKEEKGGGPEPTGLGPSTSFLHGRRKGRRKDKGNRETWRHAKKESPQNCSDLYKRQQRGLLVCRSTAQGSQ